MIRNWLTIKVWMSNWGIEEHYNGFTKILEKYNITDLELIIELIKYMSLYKRRLL